MATDSSRVEVLLTVVNDPPLVALTIRRPSALREQMNTNSWPERPVLRRKLTTRVSAPYRSVDRHGSRAGGERVRVSPIFNQFDSRGALGPTLPPSRGEGSSAGGCRIGRPRHLPLDRRWPHIPADPRGTPRATHRRCYRTRTEDFRTPPRQRLPRTWHGTYGLFGPGTDRLH